MQKAILNAKHLLKKIKIPSLPEEILQLQEELNQKYPNTVNIANLISHNPELLSNFLKLVNSNLTTNQEEFKEARSAVNAIGLDEIYNIYFSAALARLLAQNSTEKQILIHGVKTAVAAAELSYWVTDISRSEAYFMALIQNIGAIFMTRAMGNDYFNTFEKQHANPISRFQQETKTNGTNHAIVGTLVIKKWHIPDDIYKAILFHHEPDRLKDISLTDKTKKLMSLTMLSNYLVSIIINETYKTQELLLYKEKSLAYLQLPDNALKAASSAINKWGNSIGLMAGSH